VWVGWVPLGPPHPSACVDLHGASMVAKGWLAAVQFSAWPSPAASLLAKGGQCNLHTTCRANLGLQQRALGGPQVPQPQAVVI
jgi:hypothetical protein